MCNNDYKIMPMKYPILACYPLHANLLSVISNYECSQNWIYNYYIQLVCPRDYFERGMRLDFYSTLLWKSCPYVYYQRISRELISYKWKSIIEFTMDSIDLGYYVYFNVDTFFISNYTNHGINHRIHDIFIYGYDFNKNLFNVADNFKKGKYSYESATFSDILEGYNNIDLTSRVDWMDGVELISFRKKDNYFDERIHEYKFDVTLAKNFICDYLYSRNTLKRYNMPSEQWRSGDDWAYGFEIYDLIQNYIEDFANEKVAYDIRPLHVLWEHKKLMSLRIKYLEANSLIYDSDLIYQGFVEIEKKTLLARNLWIKLDIIKEEKLLNKISNLILEVKLDEEKLIKQLLSKLE